MRVLDEYIERLEHEVENKRYFLQQSREALGKLIEEKQRGGSTIHSRRVSIKDQVLKELMERPMYLPERHDPIGLNLVSTRLESRDETMVHWLSRERQLVDLQKQYLDDLKVINGTMEDTIEEFRNNPPENSHDPAATGESLNTGNTEETLQELRLENKKCLNDLKEFVHQYMAPNDPDQTQATEMMSLLTTLLDGEAMPIESALAKAPSLYRLLLRANLLHVFTDSIKLLDLS
uniref:Component of the kinetochore n=1 Tax=Nakaseomyces delphensis TaxID=51657 RepID=A7WPE3_NAKDE|nr:component of the kinetochore [Nakaseomyces delphensis]